MRQNETKSPNLISSCIHVSKPRRTSYLLVVPVVLLASWLPHLVCTLIFIHQQVRMGYLIYKNDSAIMIMLM